MRRGFTILELLVASLLLGMLMTILTMIFSQSSIAWRTGVAGVSDLDDVRKTISSVRYQADNAYPDPDGTIKFVRSVFDDSGDIRGDRGIGDKSELGDSSEIGDVSSSDVKQSYKPDVSCGNESTKNPNENYVVNVMSSGPDRKMDTYDDIWSFPDDPEEWCK